MNKQAEALSESEIAVGCQASFARMLEQRDDWYKHVPHDALKAIHDYAFHAGGEFASAHGAQVLDSLQEQQAAQAAELLSLARAYDPNCDEYHYETQLAAMKAARQTVEAMQELATYLGRDPEGCLSDVPDEAMGKIEELEAELERVRGERDGWKREWNSIVRGAGKDPAEASIKAAEKIFDVLSRWKSQQGEAGRVNFYVSTIDAPAIARVIESHFVGMKMLFDLEKHTADTALAAERERAERAEGELAKRIPPSSDGCNRLNRPAYEKLIAENIEWLKTMPRTLERDHILVVLQDSPNVYYGYPTPAAQEGE